MRHIADTTNAGPSPSQGENAPVTLMEIARGTIALMPDERARMHALLQEIRGRVERQRDMHPFTRPIQTTR